MLEQLIIELAKSMKQAEDINGDKTYWIINKDDKGLDVQTKTSSGQYAKEEEAPSYFNVSFELLKNAWGKLIAMRTVKSEDFGQVSECNTFLVAFFSHLPFVDVRNRGLLHLKSSKLIIYHVSSIIKLLDFGRGNKRYVRSENLSDHISGNLYRVKSKGRQDLRLLGFLNDNHDIDTSLLNEYIGEKSKNDVIRKLVLKQEYFQIALFVLNLLRVYPRAAKKATLVDLAMTIVRNSRGDNLMLESLAKERTHNLLMWSEKLK